MNTDNARKGALATRRPNFIKKRWEKLVLTERRHRPTRTTSCALLSELKNALRSGDIWVQGSRQFKDFDEYLIPAEKFATLKPAGKLPLAVATGLRPVSVRPIAAAGAATGRRQPLWRRPTTCPTPSSPSQA